MNAPLTTDTYLPRSTYLTRRSLLKGIGATLLLPWMESLAFADGGKAAIKKTSTPPRRWGCFVFANGVNASQWWAKGEGDAMQLSKTLSPLAPFKRDMLVLDNLHIFDDTVGVHVPFFTNFLSGEKVRSGSIPDLSESVDQFMGRTIGTMTPVPSIFLGTEPGSYGLSGGSPAIYSSTFSWSSRTTPIPPEVFPYQAFDRLFDVTGLLRDKSVLDVVQAQAGSIRRKLDARDRDKLDEYLTTIREIEKRIETAASEDRFEGWRPSLDKPDMERPPEAKPQNVREHMKLMLDIIALAWRMDKTRVASLLFQRDITGMSFNFLDGVSNTGLHAISHHRKVANTLDQYQRVNQFHVEMFAYFLGKLKAVNEGNGTLLDNSMILFGSTMRDGDVHDGNNLPLILAGGRNCDLKLGRQIRYDKLEDRRLCNLHLALAQRMGCQISSFGNSHYPLPGLS